MTPSKASLTPAVSRAVRILDLLAERPGVPVPLVEIARAIDAAKSSTSNICAVLEESDLIQRRDNGYVLGRHIVELGGAYLSQFNQIREFYQLCVASAVLSGELTQIAVLHGTDVVYLARHEGGAALRLTAGVGDRLPASLTAMGKALLSTLSPEEVQRRYAGSPEFPRLTSRSTRSFAELAEKLAIVRERGYAIDEGEVFPNVTGLAVPIGARHSGENTLAIGISSIEPSDPPHLAPERLDLLVTELRAAADRLSNPMIIT